MADINIKGRYRLYTHDGTSPFDFTTYANNLCVIRRPNEVTFVTLRQYVPGPGVKPFTTFEPGSSYTIVTKSNTAEFSMGPYTRSDRLPSSTLVKSPIFYIGLDKNSIPVPLSSYALGVNSPLSTIRTSELINGFYTTYDTFDSTFFKQGFTQGFTHLKPGSSYELRSRVPFTLFAPLQSEISDAWASGLNDKAQIGMGYQYNSYGFTQLYGTWDKVSISQTHAAALSTCGTKKRLFVCGGNDYGQLGLTPVVGGTLQKAVTAIQPVWTEVKNLWWYVSDVTVGECNGGYYIDALQDNSGLGLPGEDILDVEAGDNFTLVKTNNQLYGIGNMFCLGICAPGLVSCSGPQFFDVKNNDPSTNYARNNYLTTWTPYLSRSTHLNITPDQAPDNTEYYEVYSNTLQKFQARGMRWYALISSYLYGAGKISGTSNSPLSIAPVILPQPSTGSSNASTLVTLNSPHRSPAGTFIDFEASLTNIVALSTNFRWLIAGAASSSTTVIYRGLSAVAFYDPQLNSYVPQKDYGLRLFPSYFGAMGIMNGQLYSTGQGVIASGLYGSAIAGFGGSKTTADLPSTTLPKLDTALSPNPDESVLFRSLIPVRHINPNSPNLSWKSLFAGATYTYVTDTNNKLYVCGDNSFGQLGVSKFTSNEVSNIYTLSNIIPDDVFNVNTNTFNSVIYKTNRIPVPSFTPRPTTTPTPTPTVTPTKAIPQFNSGIILYNFDKGTFEGTTSHSMLVMNDISNSNYVPCNVIQNGIPVMRTFLFELNYNYGTLYNNYNHYSNRRYVVGQIEPNDIQGGYRCGFVFNGNPSSVGSYALCYHYISQGNFTGCGSYSFTKMSPNSGSFGDGRTSTQRIQIDSNIGERSTCDFYINPVNNNYYVLYYKLNYSDIYNVFYTKSIDRGATWTPPSQVNSEDLGARLYSNSSAIWSTVTCGQTVPNSCIPVISNKKDNSDLPVILYQQNDPSNYTTPYSLICKYSYNSLFDRKKVLATGYKEYNNSLNRISMRANFDPEFTHGKLLYDNLNRLIVMWTGTVAQNSPFTNNYSGVAPSFVIYSRLTDENNNTWTDPISAARTFPRILDNAILPYCQFGRQWDACIDDSDNTLCIAYTPDVSISSSGNKTVGWCAFTLKVKKINITTGETIFDETVLNISSYSIQTNSIKTIDSLNIYFDTTLNSLVVMTFIRGTTNVDNSLFRYKRANNSWSQIQPTNSYAYNGPTAGSGGFAFMPIIQKSKK